MPNRPAVIRIMGAPRRALGIGASSRRSLIVATVISVRKYPAPLPEQPQIVYSRHTLLKGAKQSNQGGIHNMILTEISCRVR